MLSSVLTLCVWWFTILIQLFFCLQFFRDWYNLESGRIKAFRCNEFTDFIKNAEGLKASPLKELVKYAHRTDAIIQALELENKEPRRKRKMTGNWSPCLLYPYILQV